MSHYFVGFVYEKICMHAWIKLRMESPSHIPILPPIAAMNVVGDQTQSCSSVKYSNDPHFSITVVKSVNEQYWHSAVDYNGLTRS
jgi:hypothetical protein